MNHLMLPENYSLLDDKAKSQLNVLKNFIDSGGIVCVVSSEEDANAILKVGDMNLKSMFDEVREFLKDCFVPEHYEMLDPRIKRPFELLKHLADSGALEFIVSRFGSSGYGGGSKSGGANEKEFKKKFVGMIGLWVTNFLCFLIYEYNARREALKEHKRRQEFNDRMIGEIKGVLTDFKIAVRSSMKSAAKVAFLDTTVSIFDVLEKYEAEEELKRSEELKKRGWFSWIW